MRRVIPAIALLAFACTETPTTPQAQFAKGGGGKGSYPEVSLVDYWVVPQEDGSSLIHVVADATGPIDEVWAEVAHDFFPNGVMDWGTHFEVPKWGLVAPVVPESIGPGRIGADLTFDAPWPDEPTTDMGGADPFVFQLRFWTAGFDRKNFYYRGPSPRPQGVIVNGEVRGTKNVAVPDPDGSGTMWVNSFATHVGDAPPEGFVSGSLWVEDLTLSNVTCTEHRQKGQTITLVEGDFTVTLGADLTGADSVDVWMELRLSAGTDSGPHLSVNRYSNQSAAGHITAEFEGYDPGNLLVSLVLDYLTAVQTEDRFVVYDPGHPGSLPADGNVVKTESQSCGG